MLATTSPHTPSLLLPAYKLLQETLTLLPPARSSAMDRWNCWSMMSGRSITKIGALVSAAGGYIEKSTQTNSGGHSASMTVRVPAARLDQIMTEVKGLATTVDREGVEALTSPASTSIWTPASANDSSRKIPIC